MSTHVTIGERRVMRQMFMSGYSLPEIETATGRADDTIRRHLRDLIDGRKGKPSESRRVDRDEWLSLASQRPADTRSLTARICGDPLPGRRAIDMRGT